MEAISIKNRIEWVDIFKALAITSVVIGHSTGAYNIYIYQFHMAAFFFISGYTSNLTKRCLLKTILHKSYVILLPTVVVYLIFLLTYKVSYIIWPDYNINYPGVMNYSSAFLVKELLKGKFFICWMGAGWFLVVLVGVTILIKTICNCIKLAKINLEISLGIIAAMLFFIGYYLAINYKDGELYVSLILIAQMYFCTGILAKKYKVFSLRLFSSSYNFFVFFITIVVMYYFGNVNISIVDYPSKTFNHMGWEYLAALNGIIFLYLISFYLCKIPIQIKNIIIDIGVNTLPIVFFHFLMFKIVFLFAGIDIEHNLTPPVDFGNKYWIVLTITSIAGSLLLWKILLNFKVMRCLLGKEKYNFLQ